MSFTAFSQLDGLIMGGVPGTFLTKPVELKGGTHTETGNPQVMNVIEPTNYNCNPRIC